jgi:hypothetical protein
MMRSKRASKEEKKVAAEKRTTSSSITSNNARPLSIDIERGVTFDRGQNNDDSYSLRGDGDDGISLITGDDVGIMPTSSSSASNNMNNEKQNNSSSQSQTYFFNSSNNVHEDTAASGSNNERRMTIPDGNGSSSMIDNHNNTLSPTESSGSSPKKKKGILKKTIGILKKTPSRLTHSAKSKRKLLKINLSHNGHNEKTPLLFDNHSNDGLSTNGSVPRTFRRRGVPQSTERSRAAWAKVRKHLHDGDFLLRGAVGGAGANKDNSNNRESMVQEAIDEIRSGMEFSLGQGLVAIVLYLFLSIVCYNFIFEPQWSVIDSCYFAVVSTTYVSYAVCRYSF